MDIVVAMAGTPDLRQLLDSWELELRAERKTKGTVGVYLLGVRQYLKWCEASGHPPAITKAAVSAFIVDQLEAGREANTVIARQLAIRRFSAWLADEGEIDADPLLGIKPVKLDTKVVDPLTLEELKALLAACEGKEFRDRRDEAIVRLLAETGARAGETAEMTVGDIDPRALAGLIYRGKGGKGRRIAFGANTARAIDRYLRMRRAHRLADTTRPGERGPRLWLGHGGKGFTYDALRHTLHWRAELAGIKGFYPHRLRHTMADRWLDAGGSESGLMAMAGWARPEMLQRYTKARAEARAAEEAQRLNLGDL